MFKTLGKARASIFITYLMDKKCNTDDVTFQINFHINKYTRLTHQVHHVKKWLNEALNVMTNEKILKYEIDKSGYYCLTILKKYLFLRLSTILQNTNYHDLLNIRSRHAINLYILLAKIKFNNFSTTYDCLKNSLCIDKNTYLVKKDFNKRVIASSCKIFKEVFNKDVKVKQGNVYNLSVYHFKIKA